MTAMKEMFRDVIQAVMEVELDEELRQERCSMRRGRIPRQTTAMAIPEKG